MCNILFADNNEKHYKRRLFFQLNEQNDLKLPKSNGYLQNYRKRHQECGKTCKFENKYISSFSIFHLSPSTSCESPLKESYLNEQRNIFDWSNDSFRTLEFTSLHSTAEYFQTSLGEEIREQNYTFSFGEQFCENSSMDTLYSPFTSKRLIVD